MTALEPVLSEFVAILPEPSYLISASGTVLFANRAAAELSSRPDATITGTSLHALVDAPPEHVNRYLALCARSRQLVPGGFTWLTPREPLQVRCDGAVVHPRNGEQEAIVFLRCRPKAEATDAFVVLNRKIQDLSREILERKKAERERDELLVREHAARVEAERHSRMKDEFLATLSHEMRTPLNAIIGWTHILQQRGGALSADVQRAVDVIDRNARAQSRLVEDLLDISHIISGKVRLDVQRVHLAAVIEAAIEAVRPAADARSIRLQQTLDPLAAPIKGDPNRLQQVVWNLLSNAIKFTPKGGRVQVVLERVNSHLEITVSDTGIGIDPDFLPHVFDRFRQEESGTTRRAGGLGLGLAIVKELVALHGGEVRAKSPGTGHGASFLVALPLPAVHSAEEAPPRAHPRAEIEVSGPCANTSLAGVRVLVVDDDPDGRELVRALLENCDATVTAAGSAAEALAHLQSSPPDILVTDIGMPAVDGYDLLRQVRQLPPERGGKVPAIALTAFARSSDRTRALLAGFQIHLAKPIDAPELIAAVASLSGRLEP
jgi:signal transduction histidine kinase/CheY-like chemotaxis protein